MSSLTTPIRRLAVICRLPGNIFLRQFEAFGLELQVFPGKRELLASGKEDFDELVLINEGASVAEELKKRFPLCQVLICRGGDKDFSPEVLAVHLNGQIDSWFYSNWTEFLALLTKRLQLKETLLAKKLVAGKKANLFEPVGLLPVFAESAVKARELFTQQLLTNLDYLAWLENWMREVAQKNFPCRFNFESKSKNKVRKLSVRVTPDFVYQGMPVFNLDDTVTFGGDDIVSGTVESIDEEIMVVLLSEKVSRKIARSFRAFSRQFNNGIIMLQHRLCRDLLDSLMRGNADIQLTKPLKTLIGQAGNLGFAALSEILLDQHEQSLLRDESQVHALRRITGPERVCFTEGPGGSGKTFVTSVSIKQLASFLPGKFIFLISHSNQGLDVLVSGAAKSIGNGSAIFRLGNNSQVVTAQGKPYHRATRFVLPEEPLDEDGTGFSAELDVFQRRFREAKEFLCGKFPKSVSAISSSAKTDPRVIMEVRQMVEQLDKGKAVVLASTMSSFMVDRTLELLNFLFEDFSAEVTFFDESTRGFFHEFLPVLLKTKEKVVFVGDHRQLGNIRLPEYVKKLLREKSSSQSIDQFEDGLFHSLIVSGSFGSVLLDKSRRSLPMICLLVSHLFYESRLGAARFNPDFAGRIVFLDTTNAGHNLEARKGTSYLNPKEARLVASEVMRLIRRYLEKGINIQEAFRLIGVITPYKAQISEIRELVRTKLKFALKIEDEELLTQSGQMVNTVDAFQGSEREVIILSFVRSNSHGEIGFNQDLRRLTVALSRAKDELIVIANSRTFLDSGLDPVSAVFSTLILHIKELQARGLERNAVYQLVP